MIDIIIIDDEQLCREHLQGLIVEKFPQINIVSIACSFEAGLGPILGNQADLVFIDLDMAEKHSFKLFELTVKNNLGLVFTSRSVRKVKQVCSFNNFQYIIKPVQIAQLRKVLERFRKTPTIIETGCRFIFQDKQRNVFPEKIMIPDSTGVQIVKLDQIVRCSADKNYTTVYFKNGKQKVVSKPICQFEKVLSKGDFVRVHRTDLINLSYVERYEKGKGGSVLMSDGSSVYVSVRKKQELIEKMKKYAHAL
jgi:two-component system, LytTR family, response regulator